MEKRSFHNLECSILCSLPVVLLFSLDVFITNFGNADEGNQPLQVIIGLVARGLQTGPEVIKLFHARLNWARTFSCS